MSDSPDAGVASPWRPPVEASDDQVVTALYDAYKDLVFGIALRYGRADRSWAEDVTHDVFLGVFSHVHRVRSLVSPDAWLYRITTNHCLTRLRRDSRRRALLSIYRPASGQAPCTPEHLHLGNDRLRRALAHVEAMKPEVRACFYMHHMDARPQNEIAATLKRSPSYVCRMLQRISEDLRTLERGEGTDA